MTKLKKAWVWFKNHWYIPFVALLMLCAFLIFLITKNSMYVGSLLGLLDSSKANYDRERQALEDIGRKEREAKDRILKEYDSRLKELEKEYSDRGIELDESKKKELKRIVEEGYTDPESLSRELARLFGLEHG